MGIFSRFRDIISANMNSMLEKAEDPEKMIKLMINEMEDTLVELKASCAGAMASQAKAKKSLNTAHARFVKWEANARLAVSKDREDLAREALLEKRKAGESHSALEKECEHFEEIINQYKDDISQLEEKLIAARNKHRVLVQRHIHAQKRQVAQTKIRTAETSDAFARFEQFETRIDRMEADADLINYSAKPKQSLDEKIGALAEDDELEAELQALKKQSTDKKSDDAN